jgi:hypothetical protein
MSMYIGIQLRMDQTSSDIQTNFAIAIIGMTIVCIIFIGFPLAFMLANSFRMRRKTNLPTR